MPWPLIRPLTYRERLQVLHDWPALDPYGIQAVGIQAVADFDTATRVVVEEVWAHTRRTGWPPRTRHATTAEAFAARWPFGR